MRPFYAVLFVLSFLLGVFVESERNDDRVANAVADARAFEAARTERVTNDWARNLDYLRTRVRNGDTPRIPVPNAPRSPEAPGTPAGDPADGVSLAGELATCKAERQQLIDDGARTMINYDALRTWAR